MEVYETVVIFKVLQLKKIKIQYAISNIIYRFFCTLALQKCLIFHPLLVVRSLL